MPQELRVVCCFQCRKFQTDIVKKARKWTCKLCGSRQSLVKEFARSSSGKECRLLVQQLSERSIESERLEQLVAEKVLEGRIELPPVVVAESERLVQNHEAGRKGNSLGEEGESKWTGFCRREEEEKDDGSGLAGSWSSNQRRNNSWQNRETTGSRVEAPGNYNFKLKGFSKPTSQTGTAPQSAPLMDFHRMDKKEKRQFKWEPKNAQNLNSASGKKLLFSFKPKPVPIEDLSDENTGPKRKSDSPTSRPIGTPLMSFAKKSKWEKFEYPASNTVESQSEAVCPKRDQKESSDFTQGEITPTSLMSFSKKSKWNRFERFNATTHEEESTTEDSAKLNSSHTERPQIGSPPVEQGPTSISSSASKWARFIPNEDDDEEVDGW